MPSLFAEYLVIDPFRAARARLLPFTAAYNLVQRAIKSEPESAATLEANLVPGARKKSRMRLLLERVKKSAENEDGLEGEREHTLELSAKQAKADAQSEAVRSLYRARYELRSLRFFDSKDEVKARIAQLEGGVGREAAEQIERLVSLEAEIRSDSDAETLQAVLDLRDALHLPASVFGRRAKDTSGSFLGTIRGVNIPPVTNFQATEIRRLSLFSVNLTLSCPPIPG